MEEGRLGPCRISRGQLPLRNWEGNYGIKDEGNFDIASDSSPFLFNVYLFGCVRSWLLRVASLLQ